MTPACICPAGERTAGRSPACAGVSVCAGSGFSFGASAGNCPLMPRLRGPGRARRGKEGGAGETSGESLGLWEGAPVVPPALVFAMSARGAPIRGCALAAGRGCGGGGRVGLLRSVDVVPRPGQWGARGGFGPLPCVLLGVYSGLWPGSVVRVRVGGRPLVWCVGCFVGLGAVVLGGWSTRARPVGGRRPGRSYWGFLDTSLQRRLWAIAFAGCRPGRAQDTWARISR